MSVIPLPRDRSLASALGHLAWRSLQVAAAVLVVVVPFGYATTAVHNHVLMGVGSGIAVGVGLNLRMGEHGRSTSILIGSALGVVMALIGDGQDFVLGSSQHSPRTTPASRRPRYPRGCWSGSGSCCRSGGRWSSSLR